MSASEMLSIALLAVGTAAILRFLWLDSLRFADPTIGSADSRVVSRGTIRRLVLQAEASRVQAETDDLPKAA